MEDPAGSPLFTCTDLAVGCFDCRAVNIRPLRYSSSAMEESISNSYDPISSSDLRNNKDLRAFINTSD